MIKISPKIKTLLLSHYNFSDKGPIYGPVHSITGYFRKKNIPYLMIAFPLYAGELTIVEKFGNNKVFNQKIGFKIKLPVAIKSIFEVVTSFFLNINNDYDLVVAVDPLNAIAALILKFFRKTKKVIYYTVDYSEKRFPSSILNYIYHQIDEYSIKHSDILWNVSSRIFDKRLKQGVSPNKIFFVPNSPIFSSVDRLPDNKVDRKKIIAIVGKTHGPTMEKMLMAFSKIIKKNKDTKLTIVGPIDNRDLLSIFIEKLGIKNNINFLGQVSHKRIIEEIKSSTLGLALYSNDFPWTFYGDSMKAREYAVCGVPVIITNAVSTSRDIKKYKSGIVVDLKGDKIYDAMDNVLNNNGLWKKLRLNAINMARSFDFEVVLDSFFAKNNDRWKIDASVVITHGKLRGPAHEIRDYLLTSTEKMLFVSHPLLFIKDNYAYSSQFEFFKNGKSIKKFKAFHWQGAEFLLYIKDFIYSLYWTMKFSPKTDLFIGSGNLNALAGVFLKKLGIVQRTIFYCIDYVPYRFKNSFINNIYHLVDRICADSSDVTWNLSERMIVARQERWGKNFDNQLIVPHGSYVNDKTSKLIKPEKYTEYEIVFAGSILKKQGIQLIIKTMPRLIQKYPKTKLIIIGGGDYLKNLKKLVNKMKLNKKVIFLGYATEEVLQKNIANAHLAIAPYRLDKDNFSYYGDPGKIKHYLSLGVPVIVTRVPSISKDIQVNHCGFIIEYDEIDIYNKISKLFADRKLTIDFRKNALAYAQEYNWSNVFQRAMCESY